MTIVGAVMDALVAAGDAGITYSDMVEIQKRLGHSKDFYSSTGAVGSMITRLTRRHAIYTDRSVKPYRYRLAKHFDLERARKGGYYCVDPNIPVAVRGRTGGRPFASVKGKVSTDTKEETAVRAQNRLAFGFNNALSGCMSRFIKELTEITELEVQRRVKNEIAALAESFTSRSSSNGTGK